MLYQAYEARRALVAPLYGIANLGTEALCRLPGGLASMPVARAAGAMSGTVSALRLTHERPDFGIDVVDTDSGPVTVREETVVATPFATLRRFAKDAASEQPRVLIVPGLAGHFATLVRGTIRTMLADHDVYVADWHNARDVPPSAGRFGLDEFIQHIIEFLEATGPGTHLVAVCQPCVAALAAAAIMAQDGHPAEPGSLVLMSGPVDARINPGRINTMTESQSLAVLERNMITTVPWPHKGAGRRVYPGFLQVSGFMSMAPRRTSRRSAGCSTIWLAAAIRRPSARRSSTRSTSPSSTSPRSSTSTRQGWSSSTTTSRAERCRSPAGAWILLRSGPPS